MPRVCALGRGQVDGQRSALRGKGGPESCCARGLQLRAHLSAPVTYLSLYYLRRNSWTRGRGGRAAAATIRGRGIDDDARRRRHRRRSRLWNLFLEKRVSRCRALPRVHPRRGFVSRRYNAKTRETGDRAIVSRASFAHNGLFDDRPSRGFDGCRANEIHYR